MGAGSGMTATQGILLALSVVLLAYLFVAMFKPEWF
jgi:K+-transporting ATPase KdpF subunit